MTNFVGKNEAIVHLESAENFSAAFIHAVVYRYNVQNFIRLKPKAYQSMSKKRRKIEML